MNFLFVDELSNILTTAIGLSRVSPHGINRVDRKKVYKFSQWLEIVDPLKYMVKETFKTSKSFNLDRPTSSGGNRRSI